jgi:predicted MarR family transcription regulator
MPDTSSSGPRASPLDRTSHLAADANEVAVTEFEYAVWRFSAAFIRWQGDCLSCAINSGLSGQDAAVLHVIRMRDMPKSLSEIARLLNRDDVANIQYSLKKLLSAGLLEKANAVSKKQTSYIVSDAGRAVTDTYSDVRRDILLGMIAKLRSPSEDLAHATRTLDMLIGLYDQASRIAATYRSADR